ncbi:MAG: hypothetical protein K8T10_20005 [Candidatus Eremiobacteraeota bacterium]|nr:hypothetical protein [Candidatus Eremiobacteraeota bacterium]
MLKILKFKSMDSGSLRGFLSIESDKMRMIFNDLRLMETNGTEWIAFPANKYENDEGKTRYSPYVKFTSKAISKAFTEQVLQALEEWKKLYGENVEIIAEDVDTGEIMPF